MVEGAEQKGGVCKGPKDTGSAGNGRSLLWLEWREKRVVGRNAGMEGSAHARSRGLHIIGGSWCLF